MNAIRTLPALLCASVLAGAVEAKPPPPASVLPAAGDLSGGHLYQMLANRLRYHRPDAFSPVMDESALAGRTFRVVKRFGGPDDESPNWTYDAASNTLHLRFGIDAESVNFSDEDRNATISGLVLQRISKPLGASVRQNAFGARVRVRSYLESVDVLGDRGDDMSPSLSVDMPAAPDVARKIAAGGYAVFSGELHTLTDHQTVTACGTAYSQATIDDPTETGGIDCLIGAKFESIEFYAPGDKLLGSWRRPVPQPAAAPHGLVWLRKPTSEDMAQYYPERASRIGVNGHATIECTVNANGTVSGCSVSSESPSDQEFGSAALKLAKLFKADPGDAVGTRVVIPLGFTVPTD